MKQLQHQDITNNQQTFPISIVCDTIRTPENIGMCFRIAESFGVEHLYFHESSPTINNRIVKKTARNTITEIPHSIYNDFETLLVNFKKEGYTIIGIEITDQSIDIQNYNFKKHHKTVLLLGSERHCIKNINLVDVTIAIPMYGRNSSMNVIHSLAITLYEITNNLTQVKIPT